MPWWGWLIAGLALGIVIGFLWVMIQFGKSMNW